MTIQEKAIEQLERISEHLSAIGEKEDYTDIAIKALETTCIEDYPTCTECEHYDKEKHYCPRFCQVIKDALAEAQPSGDCISREAVLDAMSDAWKHICFVARRKQPTKGEKAVYIDMCNTVRQMPPVTPQASEEDIHREREQAYMLGYEDASKKFRTESCEDAISRKAVLQIIENKLNPCTDMFKCLEMSEIKEDVEHLPSVQPKTEIKNLKTEIEKPKSEMNDLISREDVITALIDADWIKTTAQQAVITEVLNKIPSVKPKKGKWIIVDDCEHFIAKCSECGEIVDSRMINNYPYCHCGAEMSGGGEDEDSN